MTGGGSLWDCLAESARRFPDKPAVRFYGSVLTYAELVRQAETLAGWLQGEAQVRQGDRVLLFSQNCPQFIVATYAVLRADAVVVPVNAMWTAEEVAHVIDDSGAQIALVAAELADRVSPALACGALRRALLIEYADALIADPELDVPAWIAERPATIRHPRFMRWREALGAHQRPLPHRAGADDLAVLPYTSGTTGRPKGCMHTHGTLQAANRAAVSWRSQTSEAVFLGVAPLFHALGMQNGMHLPLMLGATVVMLPRWDRAAALALIERHRVTSWAAPPAMLIDFFANPAVTPEKVRSMVLVHGGSAAMPHAVAEAMQSRFGITYNEGYGMTETASFLHANPPQRPKLGSLGVPGPGVDSRIVDPVTLQSLPRGEVGEIVTHAPQVMKGYWNQPQATAEAFVEIDGLRFLRTGDLACIDEDGYFFMKDRLKRMIVVSGYKVWPAEVENTLYSHPAVHEACVIATRDARQGEAVKALVVLKPGASLAAAELVGWCRQAMAVYKAPRFVQFVDQLPKSSTGKILWRELQQGENI
ncbi:long-chain-fatty-acid--CoA ligase [Piscinibacter sp. XHJ-5]|uniref:long-chain-fatty-acid--CoA ligase n=1 Tax=Piscinibacter sp. XHJ-5 TaxID=3037797 RepID=UPI002452D0B4|nr:long-chain-fatty-acid--CoA ligase [Piscinibacter sp. XHJ-5]